MNIERDKDNPRKDYEKFGGLDVAIGFFYQEQYDELIKEAVFNDKFGHELIINVLDNIKNKLSLNQDEQSWFNQLKEIGESLKFAPSGKIYKANPEQYVGSISDVAEILRITLTAKKNSPNLYYVMKVLDKQEVDRRIDLVRNLLLN